MANDSQDNRHWYPIAKGKELFTRLRRIEKQNNDLAKKVDSLERTLSQQNLVLQQLLIDIRDQNK